MTDFSDNRKEPCEQKAQRVLLRCCVGCRQLKNRERLIRIVHDRAGKQVYMVLPGEGKTVFSGRSAYLCFAPECIEKGLKAKKLHKTLKTSLADDIVKCLLQLLEGMKTRATNKG